MISIEISRKLELGMPKGALQHLQGHTVSRRSGGEGVPEPVKGNVSWKPKVFEQLRMPLIENMAAAPAHPGRYVAWPPAQHSEQGSRKLDHPP